MKKLLILALFVFGITGVALAIPFDDLVQFAGDDVWNGEGNIDVYDNYSYTHTLEMIPAGSILNSATLSIIQGLNQNNSNEIWLTYAQKSGPDILLGTLSTSVNDWVTDSYVLGPDVLALISSNTPFSLTVRLAETTSGDDRLKLDESHLTGDYSSPVPEPASMMLLGTGLLGLFGLKRKRVA